MLFNSYAFIGAFLPIVLCGYFVLGSLRRLAATIWLLAASLVFYSWWNPRFVLLLVLSIAFNYVVGFALIRAAASRSRHVKTLLSVGILTNLALLAYYKYAHFFVENIDALIGTAWPALNVVLPLGISFFTFTQIAFLVDAARSQVRAIDPLGYGLFVTYFPHLIAGPVLHHAEMMPQFASASKYRFSWRSMAVGLLIFSIGLFKKVALADGVAPFVGPVFSMDVQLHEPTLIEAWGAALAYTFQLYFDFSGYSDMAIGISKMFGVDLPLNFNSPYKAASITDFWRRWHMTLSRFLRDYLYFALGGNRLGKSRRYANLMITMTLGGLWHGAGWTFVLWGVLHGAYLVVNHAWQALRVRVAWLGRLRARRAAVATTFLAVVIGWVLFRAPSLSTALAVLRGMSGANGIVIPGEWYGTLHWRLVDALTRAGCHFGPLPALHGEATALLGWLVCLGCLTWAAPNSQSLARHFVHCFDGAAKMGTRRNWIRVTWAVGAAALFAYCWTEMGTASEFLYFQF